MPASEIVVPTRARKPPTKVADLMHALEASLKAANEVYAETSAANADFKKIWDSIAQYRGDQYLWWQVAEYTYDSFMIRSRGKGWS